MIRLFEKGAYLINGQDIFPEGAEKEAAAKTGMDVDKESARKGTMAYSVLSAHNVSGNDKKLKLKVDAMTSHDISYVSIIQTAKASGMEYFPMPYVLTNCHNSLCAVGGTINEDDHVFGLSAAKKYGGIYVPPHFAVLHQYMRECVAGGGKMIMGSDSHTRYGALGTMAVGEGGGELVKQLLQDTYDIKYPEVVGLYMTGKPVPGVGPQDIALAIIRAVFKTGYVKNKVIEFVGPGIENMDTDFRNGIDVMTTETTCLSTIWKTDDKVKEYLRIHGREDDYRKIEPAKAAYYDGFITLELDKVKPMIALPFHPSNAYEIDELNENLADILAEVDRRSVEVVDGADVDFCLTDKIVNGKLQVQQGIIAGCAGGTYTSIMEAANLLKGKSCGNDIFNLAVYPSSQPLSMELIKNGATLDLMAAGATVKTAFCGPCFGGGDTPANNTLSIRHTTRNFPNREGSKPGNGQLAAVALMDARSIAATAINGGILTPATDFAEEFTMPEYTFDNSSYKAAVYQGFGNGMKEEELVCGPNIKDWPEMSELTDNVLLKVCSKIMDDVTTTDELIPSGETSSYRSNPLGLAEYTLSRRDPGYVARAKECAKLEAARISGKSAACGCDASDAGAASADCAASADYTASADCAGLEAVYAKIREITPEAKADDIEIGSMIYCVSPGDGSAREQAASCQKVLGGLANICSEYATKRYRSNLINWGMLPFQSKETPEFEVGDYIYVPDIRKALDGDMKDIKAYVIGYDAEGGVKAGVKEISLFISELTDEERDVIKAGCLINYNRNRKAQ